MALIWVAPAHRCAALASKHRPSHALILRGPGDLVDDPLAPSELRLEFHDIAVPCDDLRAPAENDVARIVAFVGSWGGTAPMLISCRQGISRSPAVALIVAAVHRPDIPERELARLLRNASPHATPNPLLIRLGDAALGRSGRLVDAVAGIGRGRDWEPQTGYPLVLVDPA